MFTCHHICCSGLARNSRNRATPRYSASGLPLSTQSVAPPMIDVAFRYGAPQCGSSPVPQSNLTPRVKPPISAEDWTYIAQSPFTNFGSAAPPRPPYE